MAEALGVFEQKVAFASSVLSGLSIKPTPTAIQKVVAWENAEGGHFANTARYNPLNTTLPLPGAGNTGSQGNIKVYRSWQQGIEATVKTLAAYGGIQAALRSGTGAQFEAAVNASPWGTHFAGGGSAVGSVKVSGGEGLGSLDPKAAAEQGLDRLQNAGGTGTIGQALGDVGEAGKAVLNAPANAVKAVTKAVFGPEWLGKFAITAVLLVAGAFLAIYGIMVAVRPRDRALSIPIPALAV